jgi:hypothetical protein
MQNFKMKGPTGGETYIAECIRQTLADMRYLSHFLSYTMPTDNGKGVNSSFVLKKLDEEMEYPSVGTHLTELDPIYVIVRSAEGSEDYSVEIMDNVEPRDIEKIKETLLAEFDKLQLAA